MTLTIALTMAAAASGLEVRACPAGGFTTYPLDTVHGVQSLLVQNVALINRGSEPVAIDGIQLTLADGDRQLDRRTIDAKGVAGTVAGGQQLTQSGMLDLFAFQFCSGKLLGGATLAKTSTLGPNEAILVMHQPFAFTGKRDRLWVEAAGVRQSFPLNSGKPVTMRWPLSGRPAWTVAAGSSFHTAHRWAIPEEFALDIVGVDASGSTHRGSGEKMSDFVAYGAPVLAAGPGTVVKAITSEADTPTMLRRPGETFDAYIGRVGAGQAERFAKGPTAILGNLVVIDHGDGRFSHYAHLAPGSVSVREGMKVESGTPLGTLGSSGNSTEPHLHFQVCDSADSLACSGIPVEFDNIELPLADGDRPLQSGDIVRVKP